MASYNPNLKHTEQSSKSSFAQKCGALGLDPSRIALHQKRIKEILLDSKSCFIPIQDTCRPANTGVLSLNQAANQMESTSGIVSFVPAAGASSRFTHPFAGIIEAAHEKNLSKTLAAVSEAKAKLANSKTVPRLLKHLFESTTPPQNLDFEALISELTAPKAFFPCVREGNTFLDLKIAEDDAINIFEGSVFVCSPEAKPEFRELLKKREKSRRLLVTEQGPAESTVRFSEEVEPVAEDDGGFSKVPAGHGMLSSKLPELKQNFPHAHAALIRNVDNVIGAKSSVVANVKKIVGLYNSIFAKTQAIRDALKSGDWKVGEQIASSLIRALDLKEFAIPRAHELPAEYCSLWQLQRDLFHCYPKLASHAFKMPLNGDLLKRLYQRPLNVLGQVPNTQKDVGGTPVFARAENEVYKICVEVPHASPDDKAKFLEDPKFATHFNPVFALAEIDFEPNYYEDAPFTSWLLSKKTYKGHTVYYHESVLYELLGNNILANVIFLEIPRELFNPHKSISDCGDRSITDWIN